MRISTPSTIAHFRGEKDPACNASPHRAGALRWRDADGVCLKVVKESPPPPRKLRSELPEALARIVTRCLEKEPDLRFQNAATLADPFEPFSTSAERGACDRGWRCRRHRRRNRPRGARACAGRPAAQEALGMGGARGRAPPRGAAVGGRSVRCKVQVDPPVLARRIGQHLGSLELRTDARGGEVFIDGAKVGTLPRPSGTDCILQRRQDLPRSGRGLAASRVRIVGALGRHAGHRVHRRLHRCRRSGVF